MISLTDTLKNSRESIEMARLLTKKSGIKEEENREEIREWIEVARSEMNRAEDHLDQIEDFMENQ